MKEEGFVMHYPFHMPLKVKNYSREDNIYDGTNDYTDEELLEGLRRQRNGNKN